MAAVDLKRLHWPPISDLWQSLYTLRNGATAAASSAAGSLPLLRSYTPWLALGLQGWLPPDADAGKALEAAAGKSFDFGAETVLVSAALLPAAKALSTQLGLNQLQAYLAVHRYLEGEGLLPEQKLGAEQLRAAAVVHLQERSMLLSCVQAVLLYTQGDEEHPLRRAFEAEVTALLAAGLEGGLINSLMENLEPPKAAQAAAAPGALMGYSMMLALPPSNGEGQCGIVVDEGTRRLQLDSERSGLLQLLLLCYSRTDCKLPAALLLTLAGTFQQRIFTVPAAPRAAPGGEPSHAQSASDLAVVLVLRGLELDTLLGLLAEGERLDSSSLALRSVAARREMDSELSAWGACPVPAHAPVLLAWAAFAALSSKMEYAAGPDEEEGDGVDYGQHAERAWEGDALRELGDLLWRSRQCRPLSHVIAGVLQSVATATVAAFQLAPSQLPPLALEQLLRICEGIYTDQEELCEDFWLSRSPAAAPLHFLLSDTRERLFPAQPLPLLRLLTALVASPGTAIDVKQFLEQPMGVVALHSLREEDLRQGAGEGAYIAAKTLTLPYTAAFEIPEAFPVPLCLRPGGMLEEEDDLAAVLWQAPSSPQTSIRILLGRAVSILDALKQVIGVPVATDRELQARLPELRAIVGLFSRLLTAEPSLSLELPSLQLDAAGRSADVLTILTRSLDAGAALQQPDLDMMGLCLDGIAALATMTPGRALMGAASTALLGTGVASGGSLAEAGTPYMRRTAAAESDAGRYPVTAAYLRLLAALLARRCVDSQLHGWVMHTLCQILPQLAWQPYLRRAERWQLATLALRVLRQALITCYACGQSQAAACALGTALLRALSHEGALAGYLLPALPPSAGELKQLSRSGGAEDLAERVESTALEWLRLLPLLLAPPAWLPVSAQIGVGLMQGSGTPFVTLASYVTFTFAEAGGRCIALEALDAMAGAAALSAPALPLASLLSLDAGHVTDTKLQAALHGALSVPSAKADPQRAVAACQLLVTAAASHPSLLGALLFPTSLRDAFAASAPLGASGGGKRTKDGGQEAVGALVVSLPVIMENGSGERPGEWREGALSALDGLWALLQKGPQLRRAQPQLLAAVLRAITALWQASGGGARPVQLLGSQEGFWPALAACVPPVSEPSFMAVDPESACAEAWRCGVESSALQVMFLEAFSGASGSAMCGGLVSVLKGWAAEADGAGRLHSLLLRHSDVTAGGGVEAIQRLSRTAELAAIAILRSVLTGASLLEAAASLTQECGSRALALASLQEAERVVMADIPAPQRQLVQHTGAAQVLLRAAAPAESPISGTLQCWGTACTFDAHGFEAALSPRLVVEVPQLARLQAAFRGASAAVALAEARLGALQAVQTLGAVAVRGGGGSRHGAGLPKVSLRGGGGSGRGGSIIDEHAAAPVSLVKALEVTLAALESALAAHLGDSPLAAAVRGSQPACAETALLLQRDCLYAAAELAQALVLVLRLVRGAAKAVGKQAEEAADVLPSLAAATVLATCSVLRGRVRDQAEAAGEAADSLLSCLLAASLLAMRLPRAKSGPQQQQQNGKLQSACMQLLPLTLTLARLPSQHTVTALYCASAAMSSHLSPAEWLPVLREQLDFRILCDWSMTHIVACSPNEGDTAMEEDRDGASPAKELAAGLVPERALLQLALVAAQQKDGAALLVAQDALGHLQAVSRWLLAPTGGGLAHPPAVEEGQGGEVDYGGAYTADGEHSVVHQLWCLALSVQGVLQRSLSARRDVQYAAVAFVTVAGGRLQLAVAPPAASPAQPLTLLMLQEAERTLYLLCTLAPAMGALQVALPDQPIALRRAACAFLEFAASPVRHPNDRFFCPPVSATEHAAASMSAPQALDDGWFKTAAEGARPADVSAAEHELVLGTSDYATRLAESVYSATLQALVFVYSAAPAVCPEEAVALGPEWPSPETLFDLQKQCNLLAYGVARASGGADKHVRSLGRSLLGILSVSSQLQRLLGVGISAGHEAHTREALIQLQKAAAD